MSKPKDQPTTDASAGDTAPGTDVPKGDSRGAATKKRRDLIVPPEPVEPDEAAEAAEKQRAKEDAANAEHYTVTQWNGIDVYDCAYCPFDTMDRNEAILHLVQAHPPMTRDDDRARMEAANARLARMPRHDAQGNLVPGVEV